MNETQPWPCLTLGHPDLPRLVFLHGFLGRGAEWQSIASYFSDRYYCILPDLPGHGANITLPMETALNYESLARGLQITLTSLGPQPVILVGYSLGGRIALYTSLRYPEKVRVLILESTSPGIADLSARQERMLADQLQADGILSEGINPFLDRWYSQPLFQSLKGRQVLMEQVRQSRQENDPAWMAKTLRELSPGRQPFLGDRLQELDIPILLLAGSLDKKYAAALRETAASNQRSRALVVPHAGHSIHAERPQRFVYILNTFLSTC